MNTFTTEELDREEIEFLPPRVVMTACNTRPCPTTWTPRCVEQPPCHQPPPCYQPPSCHEVCKPEPICPPKCEVLPVPLLGGLFGRS